MYIDILNKSNGNVYIYGWAEINNKPVNNIIINGEVVDFKPYQRDDVSQHLNTDSSLKFGFELEISECEEVDVRYSNEYGSDRLDFLVNEKLSQGVHEFYKSFLLRKNSKIAAIIVTYNRCDKLESSVDSIFNATLVPDELIIVNNCSTDETPELLNKLAAKYPQIFIVHTKENIGGAGGFTVGIKVAHERLATDFWIMDDDGLALNDSLLNLKSAYDHLNTIHPTGFVCSRVDWIDSNICEMNQPSTSWNWMRLYSHNFPAVQVDSCSFVSCLFSRSVLEDIGLPIHEFFIWFDDAEFTKRISKKYPCFAIMNSTVIHDTPLNQGVYFAMVNNDNLWKYKYGAINEGWYRYNNNGLLDWISFVIEKNSDMKLGGVSRRNRYEINKCFIKGAKRKLKIKKIHEFNLLDYIEV